MSKKLEDAKPGTLLVSVVRKVIKEEQGDSNMGVETNDGDVVKEIEKAADAFASRVGAGHNVEKDTINKGKGNGGSPKEETLQTKGKGKGNSKGKSGKLGKIEKKGGKGKGFKKRNLTRQDRGEEHRQKWKEKHKKRWNERKNKGDKNGGKAKKGQHLPSRMRNASS